MNFAALSGTLHGACRFTYVEVTACPKSRFVRASQRADDPHVSSFAIKLTRRAVHGAVFSCVADCGIENEIQPKDNIRCTSGDCALFALNPKPALSENVDSLFSNRAFGTAGRECGYRIMYKKRTKRCMRPLIPATAPRMCTDLSSAVRSDTVRSEMTP